MDRPGPLGYRIPPVAESYPSPTNGGGYPQVTAPPVVVVSPPELSSVMWQLNEVLNKLCSYLESESMTRSMGECVEIMDVERDENGYITTVTKRKVYE